MNNTPLVKSCLVTAHDDGLFSAEASELGWTSWPKTLITEKGKILVLEYVDEMMAKYKYNGKPCLTVFND